MICAGCAGFVQGNFTSLHRIFPFTIIHLHRSVQAVQDVQAFSSSLSGFSKQVFFFQIELQLEFTLHSLHRWL